MFGFRVSMPPPLLGMQPGAALNSPAACLQRSLEGSHAEAAPSSTVHMHLPSSAVLPVHGAVLRCAVLRCAVLRCTVLRCAVLRCAVLCCAALRCPPGSRTQGHQ